MSSQYVHIPMRRWSRTYLRTANVFACLALFCLPASAQDTALSAAVQGLKNLAQQGSLLALCPQYENLTPKACTAADKAGNFLRCPQTTLAQGGTAETCKVSIMNELRATLNTNIRAKLDASSLHTAEMWVNIDPKESAAHDHQNVSSVSMSDGPDFIKRKDFVKFRFAVYDSSKVTLSISTVQFADFETEVKKSEGMAFSFDALMCGREKHAGTCGPARREERRTPSGERRTSEPPR